MIANGALLVLEIIFLRETRGAKILARRAKALRKETGKNNIRAPVELENESVKDLLRTACTRSISLLVREPVVLAFGLWIACESFFTSLRGSPTGALALGHALQSFCSAAHPWGLSLCGDSFELSLCASWARRGSPEVPMH